MIVLVLHHDWTHLSWSVKYIVNEWFVLFGVEWARLLHLHFLWLQWRSKRGSGWGSSRRRWRRRKRRRRRRVMMLPRWVLQNGWLRGGSLLSILLSSVLAIWNVSFLQNKYVDCPSVPALSLSLSLSISFLNGYRCHRCHGDLRFWNLMDLNIGKRPDGWWQD